MVAFFAAGWLACGWRRRCLLCFRCFRETKDIVYTTALTSRVKGSAAAVVVHDTVVTFPLFGTDGTLMMLSASPGITVVFAGRDSSLQTAIDKAEKSRGHAGARSVFRAGGWGRGLRLKRAICRTASTAHSKQRDAAQEINRCRVCSLLLTRGAG